MPDSWFDQMVNLVNTGSRFNPGVTRVTGNADTGIRTWDDISRQANERMKFDTNNIRLLRGMLANAQ